MKTLILMASVILLTGCLSKQPVPIKQPWPNVPAELLDACPDLKNVPPDTKKFSEVLEVVVDNYKQYHECRAKVDDWITWYKGQKEIQDGK
jgi:hypothetical protein